MLDADVVIRGERGTFDLAMWMRQHEEKGFEVAAITVAELWHGVERASGGRAILEALPKDNGTRTRANMGLIGILRPNDR